MTRPPISAVKAYIGAALHAETGNVMDFPSAPAPLALVPPCGDRSDPAAVVGETPVASSPASAGFVEKHARFVMTSSEPPKIESADFWRRFVPIVEESNPDDLCLDAVRREMAKP
jgi:hypothetical protein